jgi:hypothetical protein
MERLMAITKTTKLLRVEVFPPETDPGAPLVNVHIRETWDDPEDDELPFHKERVITRGRVVPEVDGLERTPVDDLPQLAQDICNTVWWYD